MQIEINAIIREVVLVHMILKLFQTDSDMVAAWDDWYLAHAMWSSNVDSKRATNLSQP